MLGVKILIADDEDYILRVVSFKLRGAGYRVYTARDGESALAVARRDLPDLVITDLQMPGLSGLDLCRALAGDEHSPAVPCLLLTARAHCIEGLTPPPNLYRTVTKPFSPRQLLATVAEVLEEHARGTGTAEAA